MNLLPFFFASSLFVTLLYFFVIIIIWYGWSTIQTDEELHYNDLIKISVIIALRDEDHTLPALLRDLRRQTYTNSMYEVILVDDHSKNKISDLPEFKKNEPENFLVCELPDNRHGKKAALHFGAQNSRSELLLFTDGDCRLHPDWIRSHATKYTKEKPACIIGLVDYKYDAGFFRKFFRFDFISLVITGAGTSALGSPTLCNGANLSVKRDLYLKLADKFHPTVPSGDDIFLLHEIKKLKTETIAVLKSKHSIVKTQPPDDLLEFFNQRIRWASKGKYYSDRDTILLALLVLITNLIVVSVLFLCFLIPSISWYLLFLIIPKLIADGFIIGGGLKYFGKSIQLWLLPLFEIIYPIYIITSVTGGAFDAFTWKPEKK